MIKAPRSKLNLVSPSSDSSCRSKKGNEKEISKFMIQPTTSQHYLAVWCRQQCSWWVYKPCRLEEREKIINRSDDVDAIRKKKLSQTTPKWPIERRSEQEQTDFLSISQVSSPRELLYYDLYKIFSSITLIFSCFVSCGKKLHQIPTKNMNRNIQVVSRTLLQR